MVTLDAVKCKSTLLEDGHLALPKRVQKALGLRVGEQVELVVGKVKASALQLQQLEKELLKAVNNPDTTPEEVERLIEELTVRARPSPHLLRAVRTIADSKMPQRQQRRFSTLLFKNREGQLSRTERAELNSLLNEELNGWLRKAHASLALHLLERYQQGQGVDEKTIT